MVTWVPGHSVCTASASTCAAVMADQLERARVVAGEELDLGVVLDRVGQVGKLAVERHRDRALGERRRNALGDVEAGGVRGIVPARAVGKGQGDHVFTPVAHSLPTNAGKRASDIAGRLAVQGGPGFCSDWSVRSKTHHAKFALQPTCAAMAPQSARNDSALFERGVRDCGRRAARSPNRDHTAAPISNDRQNGTALGTRTAIKRVHLLDGAARVGV